MSQAIRADFAYALFLEVSFLFLVSLLEGQRCLAEVVCQRPFTEPGWAMMPLATLPFISWSLICLAFLFVRLYLLSLSGYEHYCLQWQYFWRDLLLSSCICSSLPAIHTVSDFLVFFLGLVVGNFGIHANPRLTISIHHVERLLEILFGGIFFLRSSFLICFCLLIMYVGARWKSGGYLVWLLGNCVDWTRHSELSKRCYLFFFLFLCFLLSLLVGEASSQSVG